MTPTAVNREVIAQRALWVREMLEALRDLPLGDMATFLGSRHNVAAAESYLRRALEALFDIGRHILAKEFAYPATEYKEIAAGLSQKGVMGAESAELMRKMAGYRNRMVHFYHEISSEELYEICSRHLPEVEFLLRELLNWIGTKKE